VKIRLILCSVSEAYLCRPRVCVKPNCVGSAANCSAARSRPVIDGEKEPRRTGAPATIIAQADACRTGFLSLRRSPVMIAEPV
jgi:hypothetical protein